MTSLPSALTALLLSSLGRLRLSGMARTGAHHSALWDKALTDAEKEAARLTIACGCGVMPAKGCQGGGGDWHEADEGEPLRGPVQSSAGTLTRRT